MGSDPIIYVIRIDPDHLSQSLITIVQIFTERETLRFPEFVATFVLLECNEKDFVDSFSFKSIKRDVYKFGADSFASVKRRHACVLDDSAPAVVPT